MFPRNSARYCDASSSPGLRAYKSGVPLPRLSFRVQLLLTAHLLNSAIKTDNMNYESYQCQPVMSRTDQYRKVMKPLLERKRRARINRCLDELKDLMVSALETEGENVQKLEKADILELTVRHLHKLRGQRDVSQQSDKFKMGYTQCAKEVSRCLSAIPGVDVHLGTQLMSHLGYKLKQMDTTPLTVTVPTPPHSPMETGHYPMPLTPGSSRASSNGSPGPIDVVSTDVWRPW